MRETQDFLFRFAFETVQASQHINKASDAGSNMLSVGAAVVGNYELIIFGSMYDYVLDSMFDYVGLCL